MLRALRAFRQISQQRSKLADKENHLDRSWENNGLLRQRGFAMTSRRISATKAMVVLLATATVLTLTCCTKKSTTQTQTSTVDLRLDINTPFRFVAYGDTRFHDPKDTGPANPGVR